MAAFAVAFAVAALVALALLFSGTATYSEIARAGHFEEATFQLAPRSASPRTVRYTLEGLVDLHQWTLAYVQRADVALPRDPTIRDPFFTADEQRHLDDVRAVFTGAKLAMAAGIAVLAVLVVRAVRARTAPRLARDGALAAGIGVTGVAAIVAVAFEPAFLAFHYVFFPQGNFLFDPATSNLLALYPEHYWYGVTLRIGIAFVAIAGLVAGAAHMWLRATRSR